MSSLVDLAIVGPAFTAGLLVLATHVPLGRQVIRRGIIFLDLALAQIAGLGALFAQILALGSPGQQVFAYGFGMTGAAVLYWCERRWGNVQEAVIGVAFILAATAAMLLIANSPRGHEHFHSLLAGQILWVDYGDLWPLLVLSALVLGLRAKIENGAHPQLFYLMFALSVTASVQLVGIYLVFASLIIPALAVRNRITGGLRRGWIIGAIAYGAGLLISSRWDLPAGPVIVWCLAGCALASGLLTWKCRT